MRLRTLPLLALFSILLRGGLARAGDPADPATVHLPKAPLFAVIRAPCLDRLDAIGREAGPMIRPLVPGAMGETIEQAPWSEIFAAQLLPGLAIERTKPLYVAAAGNEMIFVAPAVAGTVLEGVKEIDGDSVATLDGGYFRVGDPAVLAGERLGTPVEMLAGDLSIHVPAAALAAQFKEPLDAALAKASMMAGAQLGKVLPEKFRNLPAIGISIAREFVYGTQSLDYALTWNAGTLEAEGLLRTIPGSPFRALVERAGKPAENDLAGYLPSDALLTMDGATASDWPAREMAALIDRMLGEGVGQALMGLVAGPTGGIAQHLTGRTASAVSFMGMGGSIQSIAEVKEGADLAAALKALDVSKFNEALAGLGLPVSFAFEPSVAKHGEAEIHRYALRSELPQLAMVAANLQGFMAVDGRYLLTVQSLTGESDLKALIDRVRSGERKETSHGKAMARLGRTRSAGLSINLGALKPFAMLLAMVDPRAAKAMSSLPDELLLSTAISFVDGDIRWRGDWPVAPALKTAAAVMEAAKPKETEKPKAEDFE